MKRLGDERGQSMILMLLCMTCLLGFTAFATDVGLLFRAKRNVQIAVDSAAIAGAAELGYTDLTPAAAAKAAAAQNGVTDGSNGTAVAVNIGPSMGPHAGNTAYVEVIASQSQPTFFMKLFQRSSMTVSARAVATNGAGTGCIYTLGASSSDGITGSGGATLSDTSCGILDNSRLTLSGGAQIAAQSVGVVGAYSSSGGATVTPTPVTGIAPVNDPLGYLNAPSYNPSALSCASALSLSGGKTQSVAPTGTGGVACYNGISVSGGSTLNLTNPGVIVVNGNISLSGGSTVNFLGGGLYYITGSFSASGGNTATGSGVTFFAAAPNGSVDLSGGANLNLTAPTSGAYNGILFWQAEGDSNAITMSGGSGSTLEGVIYAPSAQLTMSGGSGSHLYTDLVVRSITLSGGASLMSYASLPGTTSPLTSTRLVE